jgi:hypothetical protein
MIMIWARLGEMVVLGLFQIVGLSPLAHTTGAFCNPSAAGYTAILDRAKLSAFSKGERSSKT